VERSLEILRLEIRSTEAIIRNNVRVDTELRINPAYCESIVLNLLSNTLKYRHPDRAPVVDVNATEQNGFIVLSVKDNGQGIDLDKHGKDLFGMYKTFHGNSDANGIGLFITNFQVQAMGGHIEVESKVNEGSIFKVFFRENQDTDTISTPIRNVVFIQ
jgi:signal transduction histidine kinase